MVGIPGRFDGRRLTPQAYRRRRLDRCQPLARRRAIRPRLGVHDREGRIEAIELDQTQTGDASAEASDFDARFAVVRSRLLAICSPLVGTHEAQDVVQDTYLAGQSRYERLRDPDAFDAWLIRVAINRCTDRHRRGARLLPLGPIAASTSPF